MEDAVDGEKCFDSTLGIEGKESVGVEEEGKPPDRSEQEDKKQMEEEESTFFPGFTEEESAEDTEKEDTYAMISKDGKCGKKIKKEKRSEENGGFSACL